MRYESWKIKNMGKKKLLVQEIQNKKKPINEGDIANNDISEDDQFDVEENETTKRDEAKSCK